MKIDKISLQVVYSTGNFSNIRPALEATLEAGDTPEQCLTELKQRLDNWFWETHPELSTQRGSTITDVKEEPPQSKLTQEQSIIRDISSVTDLKVLESYKLIAKNNPNIQTAYDNQLNKLTNE